MRRKVVLRSGFGARFLRPEMHDCFAHRHPPPVRVRPVDLVLAPLRFHSAGYVFHGLLDRALRRVENAEIIGVSLIRLQHRELRIPSPTQPLVAEVAIDLIHAIESAHRQPFQIKFGSDAQKQIHIQRVVMRLERTRHRSARNRMHHRRLDFHEFLPVEIPPQRLHQLAALQKHFAHFRIHHQIEIALPIAQFHVGEPVKFFRQRQQIFRKKRQFLGMNAEFARARAKQISADADMIAQVKQLPQFKAGIADRVFLDVDLQPLPVLLQVREPGLAHQPDRHDASRNPHRHPRRFQFLGGLPAVLGQNLRHGVAEVKLSRISRMPESLNLLQLLAPDFINIFVECQ